MLSLAGAMQTQQIAHTLELIIRVRGSVRLDTVLAVRDWLDAM